MEHGGIKDITSTQHFQEQKLAQEEKDVLRAIDSTILVIVWILHFGCLPV
jgi:hypothetical protein